jgi:hypothetical protein
MSGYLTDCQGEPTKRFSQMKNRKDECVNPWAHHWWMFSMKVSSLSIQFFCLLIRLLYRKEFVTVSVTVPLAGDEWQHFTQGIGTQTMGKRKEKELARICNELVNLCNQTCLWDCTKCFFLRFISHRRIIELFEMCHWHSLCSTYLDSGLKVTYSELSMSLELTRICFRMNPQDYQQIVWHGIGLCLHFSIKEASSASEFIANRFPFFKSRWRWILVRRHPAEPTRNIPSHLCTDCVL